MEKYSINYDFATTSNPKELAYFLGFFWADGTTNGKFSNIEILEKDALNIKPIFEKIGNFKYSCRIRENRQPQAMFYLNDENFAKFLFEVGKYPHSIESHSKILEYIPDQFHIYFLRGLIDGDGCFYSGKTNKHWNNTALQFTISSSYGQNWDTLIEMFKNMGINMKICLRKYKTYHSSVIISSNPKEIECFVNKLYKNKDEIWLTRKHDKAINMLKEHEKQRKKIIEQRQKYRIIVNGVETITDNLAAFSRQNGYCYNNLNKLANKKIKRYKNFIVEKI